MDSPSGGEEIRIIMNTAEECHNYSSPCSQIEKRTIKEQGQDRLENCARETQRAQLLIKFARQFPEAAKFIEQNDMYLS